MTRFSSVASIALVCVLAAAMPSRATEPEGGTHGAAQATDDLGGRWQGRSYELARVEDCGDEPCTLTLDLVRCAKGWCGVEVVGEAHRCGGTALRLDVGTANPGGGVTLFKGSLALAKGTEPYVVEAYLLPPRSVEDTTEIQITGDTGGEFRAFRRSFPFNATLARIGDAQCRPDATVSSLMN